VKRGGFLVSGLFRLGQGFFSCLGGSEAGWIEVFGENVVFGCW